MQDTTPLTGRCACGAVRFEVTQPFDTAGHCHCKRCQRRSGALWTTNAIVDSGGFAITEGADNVSTWVPETGLPKAFCSTCGGHVYGGNLDGPFVVVRLGALDGDPGIRPQWRAWLESAEDWHPVPEDDTQRFPQGRTG